jgi:hypothetical protein
MQDAQVMSWARETHVSGEMLDSVRELNRRFLDLVATQWGGISSGAGHSPGAAAFSADMSAQIAPLSASQKAAAASCPYALFDLRFGDDGHWRTRLEASARWTVADEAPLDANTLDFARLALFFAWHVASTAKVAAQLLLGMNEVTAAAFRGATIDCLPALAATEAFNLTARWSDCPAYWGALTEAAARPNPTGLRKIQLYGLQLAAAARLAQRSAGARKNE